MFLKKIQQMLSESFKKPIAERLSPKNCP